MQHQIKKFQKSLIKILPNIKLILNKLRRIIFHEQYQKYRHFKTAIEQQDVQY